MWYFGTSGSTAYQVPVGTAWGLTHFQRLIKSQERSSSEGLQTSLPARGTCKHLQQQPWGLSEAGGSFCFCVPVFMAPDHDQLPGPELPLWMVVPSL